MSAEGDSQYRLVASTSRNGPFSSGAKALDVSAT